MATLNFKGKPFVQNYHLSVKYRQLIPRKNESLTKKITAPDGSILEGCWFRSKKRFKQEVATGEIRLVKTSDGTWSVQFKQRMGEGRKLRLLMHDTAYKSNNAELDSFGLQDFPDPKPVFLLRQLVLAATAKDETVLDSFAGSGTTAHAVVTLNKEDGGNRRFIWVECDDYADKITAERVRRVIKGAPKAKDENLRKGLGGSFSYFELGPPIEMESILSGDNFPSYMELARYVFYTATGEEFDPDAVHEKKNFIGQSAQYLVYLFYKPDMDYLKATALTLDRASALGPYKKKRRLVFAPTKYLDQEHLDELRIDFAQLPFEIYQLVK